MTNERLNPELKWTMNNTLGAKIGLYKDWPVSKGCTPPYVPVWVEAMVKRKSE